MDYIEFVKSTVLELESESYEKLLNSLIGEYIHFSILKEDDLSKEILSEKLCDYFEKLELKTNKDFEAHLETYIENLNSLVENRIERPAKTKKDEPPKPKSRALKYYEKVISIKNNRNVTTVQLLDYTRIIMCLYIAIIDEDKKVINDFNYSLSCIDLDRIITSMKKETTSIIKKPKFKIKDLYCTDTFTFIVLIILIYSILDNKVMGEYYHG